MGSLIHHSYSPNVTLNLALTTARLLSGGTFPAVASAGGLLASDTAPSIAITSNGSRVTWAASSSVSIGWQLTPPQNVDVSQPVVVNLILSMSGTTNAPQGTISIFEGIGGASSTGTIAFISGTTATNHTLTIPGGTLAGGHTEWNIVFTPGAHGTDSVRLDAAWIEFVSV